MSKDRKKKDNSPKTLQQAAIDIISFARESVAPIVSERIQKTKDWVFWGADNLYPNKLIHMADNSALHSAILDTKAKMIAGDGVIFEDDDGGEALDFLEEATESRGGLNKLIEKLAVDVAYFTALSLNVQYNKEGKIGTMKHSDHSFIRSGKMDLKSRSVKEYYHSTRWDIATNKRTYSESDEIYRPVRILAFDSDKKQESKTGGQLIVNKRYTPSVIYYAKPSYLGATNYIEVAAKIANFHKNQLDNGMVGNMHVHLPQDLSNAETRRKVKQDLNDQYAGTSNAGRIMLTWGIGAANKPEVTPIQATNAHEQLATLNEKSNQEIVSGHSIPRVLTQLDQKSGLGGIETIEAIDMYQTLQISPDQQLIEDTINQVLKFNDLKGRIKIENLTPSSLILSDTLMKLSTTVNEIRSLRSEKPLEKNDERGDKLLIELENNGRGSDTTRKERPS
tara:strand:+ start:400 stop:1749 length:1350 start_codon:yes stop_codon:yes gene_type:complete